MTQYQYADFWVDFYLNNSENGMPTRPLCRYAPGKYMLYYFFIIIITMITMIMLA